jgi:hypothetical protein
LFMYVIDAHNDILMLLCLLLGYAQLRRGHMVWGLIFMVLAPLVKPIGLLPIPIFVAAAWRALEGRAQRVRTLLLATASSSVVVALAFLPFGSPLPLLRRLLDESQGSVSFSPAAFIFWLGHEWGKEPPLTSLARAGSLLLATATLVLCWWTWRGRPPVRGAADIFAVYLLTALKFRIWYPTWLFPWLVLEGHSGLRLSIGLWLLLSSQLSVVLYGHIRVIWLEGSATAAQLIGVPFVFGLPLAAASLLAFFTKRSRGRHAAQPEVRQLD